MVHKPNTLSLNLPFPHSAVWFTCETSEKYWGPRNLEGRILTGGKNTICEYYSE